MGIRASRVGGSNDWVDVIVKRTATVRMDTTVEKISQLGDLNEQVNLIVIYLKTIYI